MKFNVLIRLALVDTIGFSASTVMPLWLGKIAQHFDMPAWFAGAAVLAQLGGAAAFNLATPTLFGRVPPLRLARAGLVVAALAYLSAVTSSPLMFLLSCLVCGSALGVVLNVTNMLMGSTEHVQKSYSIFVLIGVFAATTEFLSGAYLIERFGLLTIFPLISGAAVLGLLLMIHMPIIAPRTFAAQQPVAGPSRSRAVLALAAFALFFIGQSAINALMPIFGQAAGLDEPTANLVVGLGIPCGFAGALLARLVGERMKPVFPIVLVTAILVCVALSVSVLPSLPTFIAVVVVLALATLFVVPYFFAHFGSLDRSGRYAAFGPAMMLTGIAVGPSTAVFLASIWGLSAVGVFSSVLLIVGGMSFVMSARQHGTARSNQAPV